QGGQTGGQAEADDGVLAVDHDRRGAAQHGDGFAQVSVGTRGRAAVGDQDEQGSAAGIAEAFGGQDGCGLGQAGGERRPAPGGQRGQAAGGGLDRGGGRQGAFGGAAAEGDKPDLVAALIGVEQQGQDRCFHD